jgi:hypothetical protein
VFEHLFDYYGGMTSTPTPFDDAAGDVAEGEITGFDDASADVGASALLRAVDALASGETWRCSEADLGRLVQTVEV